MFLVKTKLAPSKIHWTGVFADEFIPEGSVVWELWPIDAKLTAHEISRLARDLKKDVTNFVYTDSRDRNKYILLRGNDKYTNHSFSPNTGDDENGRTRALKNIEVWEEITDNYTTYMDPFLDRQHLDYIKQQCTSDTTN